MIDPNVLRSSPRRVVSIILGYATLLRVQNLAMVVAGVYVGGALASDGPFGDLLQNREMLVAAIAAMLVSGGANALNDAMDVDIDRVNRPGRPLVTGLVSRSSALILSVVLFAAGVSVATQLSSQHVLIAGVVTVLMVAYNIWLKRLPLVGNLAVALGVAATLVFGAETYGAAGASMIGFVFAFFTTVAREVVKDLEDIEGDGQRGLKTLPFVAGEKSAIVLGAFCIVLSICLVPVPYMFFNYSGLYLLVGLIAGMFLTASVWMIIRDSTERSYRLSSMYLKFGMLFGLLALFFAHAPE